MTKILRPNAAANLLIEVWRMGKGEEIYPINTEEIINGFINQKYRNEKIKIVSGSFNSMEGRLQKVESDWILIYNSEIKSNGRRNFTIAHELGHYMCHRQSQDDFLCGDKELHYPAEVQILEQEANQFASTLLMPIDDFKKQIQNTEIDFDVLLHCANRYHTSLTATILKWLEFTPKYAALVVSRDGFISWSRSSEPAYKKGGIFFKGSTPIPDQSFTQKAINYKTVKDHTSPKGVWHPTHPVKELFFHSPDYDYNFTLLIFPELSGYGFDNIEEEKNAVYSRAQMPDLSKLNHLLLKTTPK